MGERVLQRNGYERLGGGRKDVMKAKNEPRCGPEEQVALTLDTVNVGEEASHKKGGDQQRQGNEALKYQAESILRPPNRGQRASTEAQNSFVLWLEATPLKSHAEAVVRRRRKPRPDTIHKVL